MVLYLERILEACQNGNKPDFVIAPYNLMLANEVEGLLNLCEMEGIPVISTSPFDGVNVFLMKCFCEDCFVLH